MDKPCLEKQTKRVISWNKYSASNLYKQLEKVWIQVLGKILELLFYLFVCLFILAYISLNVFQGI